MSPSGGPTGPQLHHCWGGWGVWGGQPEPAAPRNRSSRNNMQNNSNISANGGARSRIQVGWVSRGLAAGLTAPTHRHYRPTDPPTSLSPGSSAARDPVLVRPADSHDSCCGSEGPGLRPHSASVGPGPGSMHLKIGESSRIHARIDVLGAVQWERGWLEWTGQNNNK